MRSWLIVLAALVLLGAGAAAWADPFTEVPAGTWTYVVCTRLVNLGLLPADRATGFSGKPALTRFEFATALLQPLSEVDRAVRALKGKPAPAEVREAAAEALHLNPTASEIEIAAASHDLARLASEFRTELRALGFDPSEALRGLLSLSEPTAAREWRLAAIARPIALPSLNAGHNPDGWRVPWGRGAVALDYGPLDKAPEILNTLALSTSGDGTKSPAGLTGATAALSDPSVSRWRTAYEYAVGSGLTLSLGREEIARRGSSLLPLDAATLTSLGIGYRVTPSTSVRVSYSLLDYQNYVSDAPPVRERVAETSVSIEF